MMLILSEYAKMHGKSSSAVRSRVAAGDFTTACKSGAYWYIDSDEPYPTDERVKHGLYTNRRKWGKI